MKRMLLVVVLTGSVVAGVRADTNQVAVERGAAQPAELNKEIWRLRRSTLSEAGVIRGKNFTVSGPLVPVLRPRKATDFLQNFNPFAPARYGNGGVVATAWNPFNGPGPRPRAFRDEMTEEPQALISVGR